MALKSTKEHLLPAGYIGGFGVRSKARKDQARHRLVQTMGSRGRRQDVAENLNYLSGAFVQRGVEGPNLEKLWRIYEQGLPSTLHRIDEMKGDTSVRLPPEIWLKYVIPFVAGLWVRAPEFQPSTLHYVDPATSQPRSVDSQSSRIQYFQEMADALMMSSWRLLYSPDEDFITNDRGHLAYPGRVLVPLTPRTALAIETTTNEQPLWSRITATPPWGGPPTATSVVALRGHPVSPTEVRQANQHLAAAAVSEVYARDAASFDRITRDWALPPDTIPMAVALDLSGHNRITLGNYWLTEYTRIIGSVPWDGTYSLGLDR